MRFSLSWLRDFVDVDLSPSALAARLTTGGFEVGSWEDLAATRDEKADVVFEIDITANRPDVMNHLGLAREIGALLGLPLKLPSFSLEEAAPAASEKARIGIEAEDLCPAYIGRVVVDVSVGKSPVWLERRLSAIGLTPKNNIVDASNYVLFELGQPLHVFDLDRLPGRGVVVRRSRAGERIVTVADRQERVLPEGLLVIAEAGDSHGGRPAAIAGVMGGFESAISDATRSVLIESAWFDPRSVRRAARALALHTDASHRFERGADRGMTRFAADRLAAMIAELTGGRVLQGALGRVLQGAPGAVLDNARGAGLDNARGADLDNAKGAFLPGPKGAALDDPPGAAIPGSHGAASRPSPEDPATQPAARRARDGVKVYLLSPHHRKEPILLRADRLSALLGVEAEGARIRESLTRLGVESSDEAPGPQARSDRDPRPGKPSGSNARTASRSGTVLSCRIPTWRGDLTREEDLIEEYARLTGYDAIPETLPRIDAPPPSTQRSGQEDRVRERLSSFGYREAVSYAMVSRRDDALFGPLTTTDPPDLAPRDRDGESKKGRAAESLPIPGEQFASSSPLVIGNPLSDRWEIMRRSMIPGVARALAYNVARGRTDLRLFEVGSVHERDASGNPRERLVAAIGACGLGEELSWPALLRPYDVFDLKGALESLAADLLGDRLGVERLTFVPAPVSTFAPEGDEASARREVFHPRQSFVILLDGRVIGRGGRLHADAERAIESDRPLHVAEMLLDPFLEERPPVRFDPIPKMNPVERDLSFLVSHDVPFARIEREVRRAVSSLEDMRFTGPQEVVPLRAGEPDDEREQDARTPGGAEPKAGLLRPSFVLIDRFEGGSLPSGKVSYAFRFRFKPRERALTTEELNASIETIASLLTSTLGADIRSSG